MLSAAILAAPFIPAGFFGASSSNVAEVPAGSKIALEL